MALLERRTPFPVYTNYRNYKRYLREDFSYRCAYCGIHENEFGGPRGFAVEHFRPKGLARFRHLTTHYGNLLYSCSVCNTYKGSDWPSDDPMGDGIGRGYIDPCEHDYADHFVLEGLLLRGRTAVARYMIARLALNRTQLQAIRWLREREEDQHRANVLLHDDVVALTDRLLVSGTGSPTDHDRWRGQRYDAIRLRSEEIERWQARWQPLVDLEDY